MGRCDVNFLTQYNKNMALFSDNGEQYNASYGERLRYWGQNTASGRVYDPVDQFKDVILKLVDDTDTRQATMCLTNPTFDNREYTFTGGKDIACNLVLTFKIRNNKLDLTVFNRSNDLDWGTFGANLVQFTTIQEFICSMVDRQLGINHLNSGKPVDDYIHLELGTYRQITDSLHIYTEEYGAKCCKSVLNAYNCNDVKDATLLEFDGDFNIPQYLYGETERFKADWDEWNQDCAYVQEQIFPKLHDDYWFKGDNISDKLDSLWEAIRSVLDDYLRMSLRYMFIYRMYRTKNYARCVEYFKLMNNSQWKVACGKFLFHLISNNKDINEPATLLSSLITSLPEDCRNFVES